MDDDHIPIRILTLLSDVVSPRLADQSPNGTHGILPWALPYIFGIVNPVEARASPILHGNKTIAFPGPWSSGGLSMQKRRH